MNPSPREHITEKLEAQSTDRDEVAEILSQDFFPPDGIPLRQYEDILDRLENVEARWKL